MTTVSAPQTAPARPSAGKIRNLTLSGVVHSEWIKALSLRSVRWSVLVSAVLGIGMSVVMAFALRELLPATGAGDAEYLMAVTSFPGSFLALVFAVLGVFLFSSEYSSGMILSTLTAAPRRGLVLMAKALILTAISGLMAIVIVAAGVGISVVLMPSAASTILTAPVLSSLAGTVFYLVMIALFAFAVSGILRSTAGAITTVVAVVFLLPMVFQILAQVTDWTWVLTVQNYLPMALGQTLGYGVDSEMAAGLAEATVVSMPGYWQALWALVLWAVIPMAVAVKLFFDRDAK